MRPFFVVTLIVIVAIVAYLGWRSAAPPNDVDPLASQPPETETAPGPEATSIC